MLIISATAFCKLPCSSLYAANSCTLSRRYNASFAITVASDELLSLASSSSPKSESIVSSFPLTTSSTHFFFVMFHASQLYWYQLLCMLQWNYLHLDIHRQNNLQIFHRTRFETLHQNLMTRLHNLKTTFFKAVFYGIRCNFLPYRFNPTNNL